MHVPFNDLGRQQQQLHDPITEAFECFLASGWYIMGAEHDAFEQEFAAYCVRRHAIGVASGTDALELALRCVGVVPGDEVVTVANAGGYTTTACLVLGAVPVYVDVTRESLTMSPDSLAEAITEQTKAVVATHLYGKRADLPALAGVLAGKDIPLIEDCAQAHGVRQAGDGPVVNGDLATYSFYPTKNLGALGDGGAVVTDNESYAQKLRQLRQYGWTSKYKAEVAGGRNSRLDELQAAILRVKLPHLDAWNDRRCAIAARYVAAAEGTPLEMVHTPGPDYVAHLCVGRHPDRDAFRQRMTAAGIGTAIHYPILDHQQPALAGVPWRAVDLTESERARDEIVTLPCFPELIDDEVEGVCAAIQSCG